MQSVLVSFGVVWFAHVALAQTQTTSAPLAANKAGIPVAASAVTVRTSGVTVSGVEGYRLCAGISPKYLDPCPGTSTTPILKVPLPGHKLAIRNGEHVPIPVTGPVGALTVHAPTPGPIQPSIVVAVAPVTTK